MWCRKHSELFLPHRSNGQETTAAPASEAAASGAVAPQSAGLHAAQGAAALPALGRTATGAALAAASGAAASDTAAAAAAVVAVGADEAAAGSAHVQPQPERLVVVMYGPPMAGTSTQARLLGQRYGVPVATIDGLIQVMVMI